MKKRRSAVARILAALALVATVVVVVVAVSAALKDDSSETPKGHTGQTTTQAQKQHRTKAKTYVVQTGDTLTAIAHRTGVPVSEILALNPETDPQILIAGETLKLR
jgi:LysM repeat protein